MRWVKIIAGFVFGGSLALIAVWVGTQSLAQLAAPQTNFALLAEIPRRVRAAEIRLNSPPSAPVATKLAKAGASMASSATLAAPLVPVVPPALAPVSVALPAIFTQPVPAPVQAPPASSALTPVQSIASPPVVSVVEPPAPGRVIISEIMVGSEASGDDEFIELFNTGQTSVDLTGWSVIKKTASGNESGLVAKARLQSKIVLPGSYFLIARDGGQVSGPAPDALWAKSNSLAAKNNSVVLFDSSGAKVDEASWPEIPKGSSYARHPPAADAEFSNQDTPTPGR